jgi:hypothetical protein
MQTAQRQQDVPIVLSFTYEDPNILLELLVDMFSLTIGLWMICCGQQNGDSEQAVEISSSVTMSLFVFQIIPSFMTFIDLYIILDALLTPIIFSY